MTWVFLLQVKIYPRASIDLSRKVRQLAHSIQGSISSVVGKRIARLMPKIIGAWLAGLYDNDKLVSRSSLESLTRVFSSEEKRNNLWRIYQRSILDFVQDVILCQTPLTLSDEKTVKPDDAEAKYARVAGTALLLFNRILGKSHACAFHRTQSLMRKYFTGNSSPEDLQKDNSVIEELLHSKKLWSLCSHEDSFVRRSVYSLLGSAASKEPEELDWRIVSAAVIGKSLSASQLGSSPGLSEALLKITTSRPQIWTDDYTGKSSSSKRLLQYIQKGSQGGFASFWSNLDRLLRVIPLQVLARVGEGDADAEKMSLSSASSLIEAFQDGLNSRDEPRDNLTVGWTSYIETGLWLSTLLPEEDKVKFVRARISPLLEQFVSGASDRRQWTVPTQAAGKICAHCFAALATFGLESTVQSLWAEISDKLLEAVKLSPPEQSKDYRTSQDLICAQATRLFTLETAILDQLQGSDGGTLALGIFEKTGLPLVENCLQVLQSRRGKPYAAASVVQECVCSLPAEALQRSREFSIFLRQDAPELLLSPSGERLVAVMIACRKWYGFESSFKDMVSQIMHLDPEQSSAPVIKAFFFAADLREIEDNSGLRLLVARALNKAQWTIIIAILQNQTVPRELADSIFLAITDSLSNDDTALTPLHGLTQISSSVPSSLREYQAGPYGSRLAGKLLYLTESSSEEIAGLAETILMTLKKTTDGEKSGLEILRYNFSRTDDESLS